MVRVSQEVGEATRSEAARRKWPLEAAVLLWGLDREDFEALIGLVVAEETKALDVMLSADAGLEHNQGRVVALRDLRKVLRDVWGRLGPVRNEKGE